MVVRGREEIPLAIVRGREELQGTTVVRGGKPQCGDSDGVDVSGAEVVLPALLVNGPVGRAMPICCKFCFLIPWSCGSVQLLSLA